MRTFSKRDITDRARLHRRIFWVVLPQTAIYCAKTGNSYGHPHIETITALQGLGAEIYGTDINGTIVVVTDGKTYSVQPERVQTPAATS
jgi:beta-lactamase superfamily II metal-dependent hydrolase